MKVTKVTREYWVLDGEKVYFNEPLDHEPEQGDLLKAYRPCWDVKGCIVGKCPAHSKNVNCWEFPNAGFIGSFCKGPMRPEFKKIRCSGCSIYLNRPK